MDEVPQTAEKAPRAQIILVQDAAGNWGYNGNVPNAERIIVLIALAILRKFFG